MTGGGAPTLRGATILRVLIADDHAVLRDGLRALLEAQPDVRVVGVATDGHAAVLQAAQLRPTVCLLDVAMPELNGIDATRQIMAANPAARVVILSMYSAAEYVYRALQAGARGYLLKDMAGADVVEAVRTVAAGRRYLSPSLSALLADDGLPPPPVPDALARLSPREREILQLIAEGRSSQEIALRLSLSPKTVETYRSRMMAKLGLNNVPALVKLAIQSGLITLD